jgi:hypothetical protein
LSVAAQAQSLPPIRTERPPSRRSFVCALESAARQRLVTLSLPPRVLASPRSCAASYSSARRRFAPAWISSAAAWARGRRRRSDRIRCGFRSAGLSASASNLLRCHRPRKFGNREAFASITDRNTADAICGLPLDRFRECLFGGFGMRRKNTILNPALNLERHGKSSRYREG